MRGFAPCGPSAPDRPACGSWANHYKLLASRRGGNLVTIAAAAGRENGSSAAAAASSRLGVEPPAPAPTLLTHWLPMPILTDSYKT